MSTTKQEVINELNEIIESYSEYTSSLSSKEVQATRERVNYLLYPLGDLFVEYKVAFKQSAYDRRRACAAKYMELRTMKEDGKKLSREDINNRITLECEKEYQKEVDSEGEFKKMEVLYENTVQMLNTLSSRLSMINKSR